MNAHPSPNTHFSLLLDGRLVPGTASFPVVNPATEQVVAMCPRADRAQLNHAVAAAKTAQHLWAAVAATERAKSLRRLADALDRKRDDFCRLLTQEQGKPLAQSAREIGGCIGVIRAFAAMEVPVETILKETDSVRIVRHRSPLGVVAAITPWNSPLLLLTVKLAPALLTGNTVVVKPAPTTPLTTLRLGELCHEIFPAGVVNVLTDQNDLGDALTSHPDIAKIAFTGSTATGRKVMANAAATLKRITLELGGNDPAIVLDDVDPKEVAPKLFAAAMVNSGQVCLAAKRVYLPETLYDSFCNELAKLADATVVGNGLEPDTQLGPLQNRTQFEKVQVFIAEARSRGAVIAGGQPVPGPGYFVRPTIVRDIPDNTRLVEEEQFGPVMPLLKYSRLEDAIARANNTEYGLGATIWARNIERAYEIALKIDSGTVWVNKHLDLPPDVSFGGAKQSGLGMALGMQGLEEFTQAKIINIQRG
jgi:acyl-CoA reductase-like NAD-dependent aldehyde dehydrogenase